MPLLRFSPTFLCHRWCQLAEVIAIIAPTEPAPLCCQAGYPARLQPSHHRVGTLRDHPASRIADMHTFPARVSRFLRSEGWSASPCIGKLRERDVDEKRFSEACEGAYCSRR